MNPAGPVLVIGEALIDEVVRDGIVTASPGGSPANVALGLGRLGVAVQLVTALGDDEYGRQLTDHLEASGVALRTSPLPRTSVARAVLDAGGSATYDFSIDWRLSPEMFPSGAQGPRWGTFRWIHVGSIGMTLEPGATAVRALVEQRRRDAVVSYDPNCRPSLMGSEARVAIERQVAASDLVKLSDEDVEWLYPGRRLDDVAADWLSRGPRAVVVTRGGDGASAWTATERIDVPVGSGDGVIVDTVGAGDSFMAALIASLSGQVQWDLSAALALASRVARLTCERAGADPPTLAQVEHGWTTHHP